MTYSFLSCFGASASVVLARPHCFNHSVLHPFSSSLLLAWRSLDGSFDDRLSSLVFASRDPHARRVLASFSSKITKEVDVLTIVNLSPKNYILTKNMLNSNFFLFFCWLVRAHNVLTIAAV